MNTRGHLDAARLAQDEIGAEDQAHIDVCVQCRAERELRRAGPRTSAVPYVLDRAIGSGAMGVVYEAHHTVRGTRHAVKMLRIADPLLRARMLREGRLQARLRHGNLVPVEEVIEIGGLPALVMPFVEGPTLAAILAHQPRLPLPLALGAFHAIVRGVAEIHRANLIHRDLKPANVLLEVLDDDVVPKVTDFGLAKAGSDSIPSLQTRTGAMMGTPAYAAPEQIADATSAGPPADVFSLGCILYELVAGRRAYPGLDRTV